MYEFEMGPIRPPSEAASILLRLTRNCSWNKCAFCPVYKGEKFSIRKVDEIKADIDAIAAIAAKIYTRLADTGASHGSVMKAVNEIVREEDIPEGYVRQVAFWIVHDMKSLFLQDADSLFMKTDWLVEILVYIKEKFPTIERITSYARAKTISRKSLEELKALRRAGLNRIHIGLESGSDPVLDLICKGVTQEEQIEAGRNVMEAGFELSEYFMPGVGGTELMEENAMGSAEVLNAVNPTFIRIRSVIPVPGTPLHQLMADGKWTYPREEQKVRELKILIENLTDLTSTIKSDHIMNLIEEVEGVLPADKDKMIDILDSFLEMNVDDKESFIIGRRIGRYRFLKDYKPDPEVEQVKKELKSKYSTIDEGVLQILWNYI